MNIIATKVKAKELRPGDLFSVVGQSYWDSAMAPSASAVGERVFVRTSSPCPEEQVDDEIYLIDIVRGRL